MIRRRAISSAGSPAPAGIGREPIMAWADARLDIDRKQVQNALARYCARPAYRRTILMGAMRIDLQGEPVDAVTAEAEYAAKAAMERDRGAAAQAVIARAQRQAKAAAQQAKLKAEAAAPQAGKATKPPKQMAKPPAAVPPVAVKAPPPKPTPAIVVKKRRSVTAA